MISRAVLQCWTTPKAWWEQLIFFEQIVPKKGMEGLLWLAEWKDFSLTIFLLNLQWYVADPSGFPVLWSSYLFFFWSVFHSPSFFHFFFLLIFFGGGTCVTSVFISVLLLDSSLAKKFVMLHFLCIGWVSFGFTWMIHSGNKMVWLAIIF